MARILIAIALLIAIAMGAIADDDYYYSDDRKIRINPISDKIVIGFDVGAMGGINELYQNYPELDPSISAVTIDTNIFIFSLISEVDIDSLGQRLSVDTSVFLFQRVFENELGGEVAFGNRIALCRSEIMSQRVYDSLLTFFGLEECGYDFTKESVRYLRKIAGGSFTVLETANRLYDNSYIRFCHPIFESNFQLFYSPSDRFFKYQWNLYNENNYGDEIDTVIGRQISATKAWDIIRARGDSNLIIAVLDDGITNHPDFPEGGLVDTIDIVYNDSNCVIPYNDSVAHGFPSADC